MFVRLIPCLTKCRTGRFFLLTAFVLSASQPVFCQSAESGPTLLANRVTASSTPFPKEPPKCEAVVKPLSKEELEALLKKRVEPGMSNSFRAFANMYIVRSSIELRQIIALVTESEEIEEMQLESPFPQTYKPTLKEFLDAIATQTGSQWQYDPTNKFIRTNRKDSKPMEGIGIFEFKKAERKRPYEFTLANGWQSHDKGSWVMCVPPTAPVGMDIYELGTYSSDTKTEDSKSLGRIPFDIALEWARRVKEKVDESEIRHVKVGSHDTCFFETTLPSKLGKDVYWRHWVFMSGNRCYLVLSTLITDSDATLLPDVMSMIKSMKEAGAAGN